MKEYKRMDNQCKEVRDMVREFVRDGRIDVELGYALVGSDVAKDYITSLEAGDSSSVSAEGYTFEYKVTNKLSLELEWEV
ncbi:MAG: hypothetical protein ACRCU6_12550 [Fusobacteriaceae bacterium]